MTLDNGAMLARYEYKYVVSEGVARAICAFAAPYVKPDEHTAAAEDGRYLVTSLYLDTPALDFFADSRDGVSDRLKLRVRY